MSWLTKLKTGLSKSSGKLSDGISGIFTKRKLDVEALEQLEELLIEADIGVKLAAEITTEFGRQRLGKDISPQEVKEHLAQALAERLGPYAQPLVIPPQDEPYILLIVGVNGNGKTTTIGKLAAQFMQQGHSVMLAAADTFRAAAVEQLQVWGRRAGVEVVTGAFEADPASVAFQALERARAENIRILMIDSAGRLHTKTNLMQELQKTAKVLKKLDPHAPHRVIQVLDATTGQNALAQVEVFREMVQVDGLIVTKLDGSAKGGVVVALAERFKLPIHAIGVGEGIDDLNPFNALEFARHLTGAEV